MVICKFYMQGRCKFGDNCRNEHPDSGGGAQRQLRFDSQDNNRYRWTAGQNQHKPNPASTSVSTPEEIISSLSGIITTWEQGKMWPFSCLALEKDMPCVPEFSDILSDELRWEAYETQQKSGNLNSYAEKVKQLMTDYTNKRQILKNPPQAVKQQLIQFINNYRQNTTPDSKSSLFKPSALGSTSVVNSGNTFGGQSSNSIFGGQSSFGSQTQNSGNLFGGQSSGSSSNTFGQSAGSIFGQSANVGSSGQGQGQASSGSIFGQTAAASPVFGQTPAPTFAQTGTNSIFGQSQTQPTTGSIFGQSTGAPSPGSIFGQSTSVPTPGSVFGQTATAPASGTLFGKVQGQTTAGSVFGGQVQGQSSSSSNLFSGSQNVSATTAHAGTGSLFSSPGSTFGNPGATPPSTFGTGAAPSVGLFGKGQVTPASNIKSTVYTPLDKLTADERAQFEADHFVLGRVPVKPPPRELVK